MIKVQNEENKQFNKFRWLGKYLQRYKHLVFTLILLSIIIAFLQNSIPLLIGDVYENLTTTKNFDKIIVLSLAMLIVKLFHSILSFIFRGTSHVVSQRITRDIREELFQSILSKEMTFHDHHQSGDLINRIMNDSQVVGMMFRVGINNIILEVLSFLIPLMFIYSIEPQLLFLPLLYVLFFAFSLRRYDRQYTRMTTKLRATQSQIMTTLSDVILGIRLIKVNNALDKHLNTFLQQSEEIRRLSYEQGRITAGYPPLFVLRIVIVIGFLHAYWLYTNGMVAFYQVIQFIGFITLLTTPSQVGIYVFSWYRQGLVSAERILSILTRTEKIDVNDGSYEAPIKGVIELNNVTFGYHPDMPVLKNCSVKITAGQKVALVGMTGSGKSTLFKLIARIHEPQNGQLLIDGIDVKQWKIESLRAQIALLEQEPMLFNRSIKDNITFGKDASLEEVIVAAKIARAHDFIMQLEQQYDTIVEENGRNLSGGQRQRIAVARLVLRDPRIILLDDFSSAVDSQTEAEILNALHARFKDRTILMTATRASHLQWADTILILEGGQVIACGSHEELISSCNQYRMLWQHLTARKK